MQNRSDCQESTDTRRAFADETWSAFLREREENAEECWQREKKAQKKREEKSTKKREKKQITLKKMWNTQKGRKHPKMPKNHEIQPKYAGLEIVVS